MIVGIRITIPVESYSFLSDIERSAVERMSSTIVNDSILAMLSGLDRDALHSAIAKFIQHEHGEMKVKGSLAESARLSTGRTVEVTTGSDPCTWDDAYASSRNFKN